jgi:uncharacterized protein (TIGR02646 family)
MHRVNESPGTRQRGDALCSTLLQNSPPQNGVLTWQLTATEQHQLISLLTEVFGGRPYGPNQSRRPGICAYCERACDDRGPKESAGYNEVDHFRPRSHFNDQTFTWDNLMYVCHRCNQTKDDQFPGKTLDPLPQWWASQGYIEPTDSDGYINPRTENLDAFVYFTPYGEIEARRDENDLPTWSRALRTIYDLRLKDYDLCELRREQFFMVYASLRMASGRRESITRDFTRRDRAFSSFIIFARDQGWFDSPPPELEDFVLATIAKLSQ